MAPTSTFPTIRNVLYSGDNLATFTAGEAITAGQVVGIAATGVAMTVIGCNNTAEEIPFGVALYDADSGAEVSVALSGCIVYVAEGGGNVIDAGDYVQSSAADAINGCVEDFAPRADLTSGTLDVTDDTAIDETTYIIGIALDDFSANLTGRIMIKPMVCLWSDHAVV